MNTKSWPALRPSCIGQLRDFARRFVETLRAPRPGRTRVFASSARGLRRSRARSATSEALPPRGGVPVGFSGGVCASAPALTANKVISIIGFIGFSGQKFALTSSA